MQPISVLMSVYKNEKPENFMTAVNSIINQTVLPTEVVLIRDGDVTEELQDAIDKFLNESRVPVKYIPFSDNRGLGKALQIGVEAASNELIARMDTDDIAVENRFELQLSAFDRNPMLDLVGGQVLEFENDICSVTGKRTVPVDNDHIAAYLRKRNAFNHPTVMFRKSSVLRVGNYLDRHYVEDYDLWLRMMAEGCIFANLPETLVYMRVSQDMYKRRGGAEYLRSLIKLEKDKYSAGITSAFLYLLNVSVRFVQCVIARKAFRRFVYQKILRK